MRIGARACPDHRSQGRARGHAQEAGATGWKIPRLSGWPTNCSNTAWRKGPGPNICWTICSRAAATGSCSASSWSGWRICSNPVCARVYADLFSEVIARRIPGLHADHLTARYERVRRPRVFDRDPDSIQNVFVLSRVTLGADIAVTSMILDAAKQRFPNAAIWFVGPKKSWELFAADPRLRHLAIAYGRGGSIDDRLSVWPQLREAVSRPRSIVIDPDSRLTQLGLLPICPEEDYYLFESRSYGSDCRRAADRAHAPLGYRKPSELRMRGHISPRVWMRGNSRQRSVSASAKIHPSAFPIRSKKKCCGDCRGPS